MLFHKKNIFIVEDHPLNRLIYLIHLGKNGANLFFDPLGKNVVTKLNDLPTIDLIILDLILPSGRSGFEIYKEIKAVPAYQSIPIVAISASEEGDVMQKAQTLGFSAFIAKPFAYDLFPQQILKIMLGESLWVSSSA